MFGSGYSGYGFMGSTDYNNFLQRARTSYGDGYTPSGLRAPQLSRMDVPEVPDPNVPDDFHDKPWKSLSGRERFSLIAEALSKVLMVRASDRPGAAAAAVLGDLQASKEARKRNREEKAQIAQQRADQAKRFNAGQEEQEQKIKLDLDAAELQRRDKYDAEGRAIVEKNVDRAAEQTLWEKRQKMTEAAADARDDKNFRQQKQLIAESEARQRTERLVSFISAGAGVNPEFGERIADKLRRGLPLEEPEQAALELSEKMAQAGNDLQQKNAIGQFLARDIVVGASVNPITKEQVPVYMTYDEKMRLLGPFAQTLVTTPGESGPAGAAAKAVADDAKLRQDVQTVLQNNPRLSKDELVMGWLSSGPGDVAARTQLTPEVARVYDEVKLEEEAVAKSMAQVEAATDPEQLALFARSVAESPWSPSAKQRLLAAMQQKHSALMAYVNDPNLALKEKYARGGRFAN